MVSKNFRFLYKSNNDKQAVLAKMFHVSQSNISAYVNGKKEIPIDIIKKISIRYKVSVDDLLNEDLSMLPHAPQTLESKDIFDTFNRLFLVVNIQTNNRNYTEAYRLFSSYLISDVTANDIKGLEKAISLFQKAWDESKIYAALANSITAILLFYVSYGSPLSPDAISEIARKLMEKTINLSELAQYYLRDPNKSTNENPHSEQIKAFSEKYYDLVYKNIKLLKANTQFSELGDYYWAVFSFFDFNDDRSNYEINPNQGFDILMHLYQFDNKYASDFLDRLVLIYYRESE